MKDNILENALSIIDKNIRLDHKEIARKIYAKTNYCDQDYNKFLAVISSGDLTLKDYIRKRRLYLAADELINNPDKSIVDISSEFGYSEQTAFTRAIKREFNKTPTEIRKSQKPVPDVREILENHLANKSRLDSILDRFESDNLSNTDWDYFETFIHATDEYGFDPSSCCLISELAERLSVPFAHLLERCFDMMIDYNQYSEEYMTEKLDFMEEAGIESEEELKKLCHHYDCKWYELSFGKVQMYRLGIDSPEELAKIWNYYNCKWIMGEPYPITKQMVQDYRQKQK